MPLTNVEVTIENTQVPGVVNNVPTGPAIVQVNQGPAGLNFANPMTDAGDLIVGGANGNPARLAKGAARYFLRTNDEATALEWQQVRLQPRGQMWFQNNSTPITLSTNYQKIDVASAALDEAIDFDDPVNTRMTYTGATPKVLNVIATVDLYHASGGPMQASVKLRFNDQLIDATQCNATIANQSVGKLHTMWMIEFHTNDYIELWVAATSGAPQVTPVRMRMQVTPLL